MVWISINQPGDQAENFTRFGVTFRLQFGVQQGPIHTDLELTSIRGNENH